jgi:aryl-alcohol dehydrogenase-like predicted oxidoreductase
MIRTVNSAIENGITVFDTAPIYGLGRAEEILGKALSKQRERAVICTKAGVAWKKGKRLVKAVDCSAVSISREVDMSLRRLGTDYIDFYLIHWPDRNTPLDETLAAMDELKNSGKVLYTGYCNCSLSLLKKALTYTKVDAVQIAYSLIERSAEDGLLPYCRQADIAVFAYSPLGRGLLTGMFDKNKPNAIDYHRSKDKNFQGEALQRSLAILEAVKHIACRMGKTPAQVALRWVLENPCVTTVLFGVDSSSQLIENLLSLEFTLSREDKDFLDDADQSK